MKMITMNNDQQKAFWQDLNRRQIDVLNQFTTLRHDGRRDRTFRNLPTALAGLLKSFVVADVVVEGILIMVGRLLEGPPRSAEGREEVMVLERVSLRDD